MICPLIENQYLPQRHHAKENLPLSFGKKKAGQRKPIGDNHPPAFATPRTPGVVVVGWALPTKKNGAKKTNKETIIPPLLPHRAPRGQSGPKHGNFITKQGLIPQKKPLSELLHRLAGHGLCVAPHLHKGRPAYHAHADHYSVPYKRQ